MLYSSQSLRRSQVLIFNPIKKDASFKAFPSWSCRLRQTHQYTLLKKWRRRMYPRDRLARPFLRECHRFVDNSLSNLRHSYIPYSCFVNRLCHQGNLHCLHTHRLNYQYFELSSYGRCHIGSCQHHYIGRYSHCRFDSHFGMSW